MKLYVARLLLIIYLMALIPGTELAKLPYMWSHYQEHKLTDAAMDFWDFIKHHYCCGNKVYADAEKDMKLPFKSEHNGIAMSLYLLPDTPLSLWEMPTENLKIQHRSFIFKNTFFSLYEGDCWQPPKIQTFSC